MTENSNHHICIKLTDLEQLVQAAGDHQTGNRLRDIESPDQIKSLYAAFAKSLRKAKKKDISLEARYRVFSEFVSSGGLRLLDADTRALASVTRHWELTEDNVKALEILSHLCRKIPIFSGKVINLIKISSGDVLTTWRTFGRSSQLSGKFC